MDIAIAVVAMFLVVTIGCFVIEVLNDVE